MIDAERSLTRTVVISTISLLVRVCPASVGGSIEFRSNSVDLFSESLPFERSRGRVMSLNQIIEGTEMLEDGGEVCVAKFMIARS